MLMICSDSPNLPPLFDEAPPLSLAVTHAFTSICTVIDAKTKKQKKKKKKKKKRRYTF